MLKNLCRAANQKHRKQFVTTDTDATQEEGLAVPGQIVSHVLDGQLKYTEMISAADDLVLQAEPVMTKKQIK